MKLLPFDTETTGLIQFKEPSGGVNQPHMVQVAAMLIDSETKDTLETMNVIIKPDGWVIPQDVIDVHGITNEHTMDVGIPEIEALQMFIDMWKKCDLRIAHNTTFDNRIIRIALKRYMPNLIPDEVWKDRKKYYCTWMSFKKLIGGKKGHTLAEAYKYFMDTELEGAHDAMIDIKACMEVYWGLKEAGRT
ncbi:MAG: DNA polymerase III subunit epsilon [Blastopirellula sp.]|nr:MAG: DNA polymerase III subunit epsilon [Blastopirellula sp.]